MMTNEIRLILAEDHPLYRQSLRELVQPERDLKLLGEAADYKGALKLIKETKPDVALLDIHLDKLTTFKLVEEIRQAGQAVKIIFITGQDYAESLLRAWLHKARLVGAKGLLLKSSPSAEILKAIRTVAAGGRYTSAALAELLLDPEEHTADLAHELLSLKELTPTERCILRLFAQGQTTRQISEADNLEARSIRTIEKHLDNISAKLHLKGRKQLFIFAVKHEADLL